MSCSNWEEGTIKIPKKHWAKFRSNAVKDWNKYQNRVYTIRKECREFIVERAKGTRGKNREAAMNQAYNIFMKRPINQGFRVEYWDIFVESGMLKPTPKKADFKPMPISKSLIVYRGGWRIELQNATHTMHWHVSEGNRAVDYAHAHPFIRDIFIALNHVEWGRGSGGVLIGNDEYNICESSYEGGGANYATYRFGPKGEESRKRRRW